MYYNNKNNPYNRRVCFRERLRKMEGGSNGTSCLMNFGDNIMMPPPPSSSNNNNNTNHSFLNNNNNLFIPLHLNHQDSTSSMNFRHQEQQPAVGCYFMDAGGSNSAAVKAKIMSHPHYHRLLSAFVNCQKIGAPADVVARLEEACSACVTRVGMGGRSVNIGEDPGLDQFMEAYCEMLTKYEQELSKPFKEAMIFLSRIESQFKSLSFANNNSPESPACHEVTDRNGSSEEEIDVNNNLIDPQAEDRELKGQLLRKYSGYLGSLKQEFMKKRKKGKLPKEARQQLLEWWSRHYKWPYPSESQKLALAESTGLDQKQINNWFINQRKRHWKPSEDMQFVVMDAAHQPHYYSDNVLGNPFAMDISPALL